MELFIGNRAYLTFKYKKIILTGWVELADVGAVGAAVPGVNLDAAVLAVGDGLKAPQLGIPGIVLL